MLQVINDGVDRLVNCDIKWIECQFSNNWFNEIEYALIIEFI